MENLRWILLAAGAFFILAIYLIGRQRRRRNSSDIFNAKEDLPGFSARDWDDLDEGVGEVRIVARERDEDDVFDTPREEQSQGFNDEASFSDNELSNKKVFEQPIDPVSDQDADSVDEDISSKENKSPNAEIIVLHILAKSSNLLTGDKINSAAQANGLVFGQMNIFHCLDGNGQTIFSLANMMEPGYFDPDAIHDVKTSGLTMFMQLSNQSNPSQDFDDMLRCAYHISEMLGASLCNHQRQPITQIDAENYRKIISEKENS